MGQNFAGRAVGPGDFYWCCAGLRSPGWSWARVAVWPGVWDGVEVEIGWKL